MASAPLVVDRETLLRIAQRQQIAHEGVLVDCARGVELSLYIVADSRCALHLSSGDLDTTSDMGELHLFLRGWYARMGLR